MNLHSRVVDSFFWVTGARLAGQVISWLSTIVVMRILSPGDYGLMAMAAIVSPLSMVAEFGFGAGIVRAGEVDDGALRRVFGLVLTSHVVLFAVLVLAAPVLGWFYGSIELVSIVRLVAFQCVGASFAVVPRALLERALAFRRLAVGEVVTSVGGALTTLGLALTGHGVWALAIGSTVMTLLRAVVFNLLCPFFRRPVVSTFGLSDLLGFGATLTVERVLWSLYSYVDILVAGKWLGPAVLGVYAVGKEIAALPVEKVSPIIQQIVFPAFAIIQGDRERVARGLLHGVNALSIVACPVFLGIAAVAPDLILTVLGTKWLPAALPLTAYSLILPLSMVSGLILTALKGVGRARLSLTNVATGSLLMTSAFLVGPRWGLLGLSLAWPLVYPLQFLNVSIRSSPALGTHPGAILRRCLPPLGLSLIMLVVVVALRPVVLQSLSFAPARLAVLVLAGAVVYGAGVLCFRRKGLSEALHVLRGGRGGGAAAS